MTKKIETRRLIIELEKTSRATKKQIWKDLAERIDKPSRNKADINIDELDSFAKKFKGKILLVPGKVLSKGELNEKVKIVAISASEKAKEKINAKGEFVLLRDFISEKVKVSEIMIVK